MTFVSRTSILIALALAWVAAFAAGSDAPIDLNAEIASGAVTIHHSPLDIGSIADALDGNAGTLARSASVNPLIITLTFDRDRAFTRFRTRFLAGSNRWTIETADTGADLESRSGSYALVVPGRTGEEATWSDISLPNPRTARVLRFSLTRLTGDDYVHLTDLELFETGETIVLNADRTPPELSWNVRPGSFYAVQVSHDLVRWTDFQFVEAAGDTARLNADPDPLVDSTFFRVRTADADERESIVKKALILNYDPILESEGNRRVSEHFGWNDPHHLMAEYFADLNQASGGYVKWEIVGFEDLDEWPAKTDGFRYTDESYLQAWRDNSFHQPDSLDYVHVVADNDLDRRVREGKIDEVILWGFPYAGFYESRMVGATAYWCNAPPLLRNGTPLYIMMGLNYERGVAEALHSFGHRAESILTHVYGSWSRDARVNHLWDQFSRHDLVAPNAAACGNV